MARGVAGEVRPGQQHADGGGAWGLQGAAGGGPGLESGAALPVQEGLHQLHGPLLDQRWGPSTPNPKT
jgi:hypothetical protein